MNTEELVQALTPTRDDFRSSAQEIGSDVVVKDCDDVGIYTCRFTLNKGHHPVEHIARLHIEPAVQSIVRELEKRNRDGEFGIPFLTVDSETDKQIVMTLFVPVKDLPAPVSAL